MEIFSMVLDQLQNFHKHTIKLSILSWLMTYPSTYKSESGNAGNGIIIIALFSVESKIKVSAFKLKTGLFLRNIRNPDTHHSHRQ